MAPETLVAGIDSSTQSTKVLKDLVWLNDARTPGEHEAAAAVLTAIETILTKGRSTLTLDMGGTVTTAQLGTAISQERSASRPRR